MSIKKKLLISALIMTVIPAVLIIVLSALLVGVFLIIHPEVSFSPDNGIYLSDPYIVKLIVIWGIMSLAVVLVTAVCVQLYVGRSILIPLGKISDALWHLKNGDLNYEFSCSGDRELREISMSFEELRLRLQRSVRKNIKKDNDRRMLIVNISHDIKTPITSIKGYIEGIRDGIADTPEKQRHYLNTIYAKAEAIEQMVENLSIYSKLELGKMQYNRTKTDVFEFLRNCADEFCIDLQNADMDLEIDIPDLHITAMLDKEKLRRVFSNIITNAIKYKKFGRGSLKIFGEIAENGVVMTFSDSGKGISESDLPSIFDEFYRADPSRNTTIEGSGLGLSICKKIIADHGGKIWARSKLGTGTEISVFLPNAVLRKGGQE